MKWFDGIILATVEYQNYVSIIQQFAGRQDLYILICCPDGSRLSHGGICGWQEAKLWVENQIKERLSQII